MASKRTYQFDIVAGIQGAIAAVDNLTEVTQRRLNSIDFKTGISAFRDGFDLVKGAAETAFNAISDLTNQAVAEALEAEKANNALANSLRLTGDYSAEAAADFDDLAQAISSVSTFTGDAVKESVALAKQYRLTNAEAKNAVRVAADLAAVQGISLEQATQKVAQTFNGFVDKSLAKVIPALKNLSKDALVAGDAVALIGAKVQGSAEILGDTFAGATFRAKEALNDVFETFGNFIIQNPAIIAGINAIAAAFRELNSEIQKNGGSIQGAITEAFVAVVQAAPGVIKVIEYIAERMNTLVGRFRQLKAILSQPLTLFSSDPQKVKALTDELDRIGEEAAKNQDALDNFFTPLLATTEKLAGNIRKVADEAVKAGAKTKGLGNLGPSSTGEAARREDVFGNPEDMRKRIEEAAKEPIRFAFEAAVKAQEITAKEGIAIGAGLVQNILKGAQGAQKLLQEGIGAAANLLLPGIGGAVSDIVGVLSQGPEATKKMVEEFANAIPTLIQNLADSLPVLVETLVRTLPPALAKAMPTVAIGFSTALISNIPEIVKGFAKGLVDAAGQFVQAIIDAITGVGGDIWDGITGKDSGGIFEGIPVLGGIGDIFGFAGGGRIPDMPQYRNDGAIIRADAGEQIFNRDLTARMERYLDANEGTGNGPTYVGNLQLQMGLETFANLSVEADRRGFRLRAT